ncbi:Os10g0369750 [Oryza sativa Japonica Group]|uniref:Os10g0369750 protein n=1 Tax=Oryza sativa subsp. japonica TaxID=39947 RepID=A0A0P0XTD7_ORYSJ|nr:hypothetical protein EE612_050950 [Oryza sativa]BAT10551.1 Os10g0369750 [Oryza sativa Japonica Group]
MVFCAYTFIWSVMQLIGKIHNNNFTNSYIKMLKINLMASSWNSIELKGQTKRLSNFIQSHTNYIQSTTSGVSRIRVIYTSDS